MTVAEAALGATVKVPTPGGGRVSLKVPAGSQDGAHAAPARQGHAQAQGRPRQTCWCKLRVQIPGKLTKDQKQLFEKLAATFPDPRSTAELSRTVDGGDPVMRQHHDDDRPLFMISVAAELAGMHPQTLRLYERRGLVRPQRTAGKTRRYSERDVERLQRIQELTELGLNLAGVERVLAMEEQLETHAPPRCSCCRRGWTRRPWRCGAR